MKNSRIKSIIKKFIAMYPVTIPAGSKKASFTIGVADVEELQASSNFTVTLAEDAVLPEKRRFPRIQGCLHRLL